MLFVLYILTIVDIFFRLPLQSETMLESLIEILRLPSSKIPSSIKMPDDADISGDEHGAVGIFFDDKILVRYFELMKNILSNLVQFIFILAFEY